MKARLAAAIMFATVSCSSESPEPPKAGESPPQAAQGMGNLSFPNSCQPAVAKKVEDGIKMLHHMAYGGAKDAFLAIITEDPNCGMAYWGAAVSLLHPLWPDPFSEESVTQGKAWMASAMEKGDKTSEELAFLKLGSAIYDTDGDKKARVAAFGAAAKALHEELPNNDEAQAWHALGLLVTADKTDKTHANQKEAGGLMEALYARNDKHPAAHHYMIHAYDHAELAEGARKVAYSYGDIAPLLPHPNHMASHIATRLGDWEQVLMWDHRAMEAANVKKMDGKTHLMWAHSADYLTYAYLQRGDDAAAKKLLEEIVAKAPHHPSVLVNFAWGAMHARYVVERKAWSEFPSIANLAGGAPTPWSTLNAHYGVAIAAARAGDAAKASEAAAKIAEIKPNLAGGYWGARADVMTGVAEAWATFAKGGDERTAALDTMRKAIEIEENYGKSPITPGYLLPAREMLGDMLMETGDYAKAAEEYAEVVRLFPGRLNALYGLGMSAEKTNNVEEAKKQYAALLAIVADAANSPREAVKHAQAFVNSN